MMPTIESLLMDDVTQKVECIVRVWVNGHERAERQLEHQTIAYEALDNGFFAGDDTDALQVICDGFGVAHIEALFRKWLRRLPHPFTAEDRKADFRYELSILQLEMSKVFEKPLPAGSSSSR